MITVTNITDAAIVALAKCKAATCMRAGSKSLDPAVAKLTYLLGHNHKVDPRIILDFQREGLIRWDNGTVITAAGDALLAEILTTRAKETR
jgi:hypothetical protein